MIDALSDLPDEDLDELRAAVAEEIREREEGPDEDLEDFEDDEDDEE